MKITFVTPPSAFQLDERVFVSLGILKVAAAARNSGFEVEHLDLSGVDDYEYATFRHFSTSHSDVAAFTATTPQMPAAYRIARQIGCLGPKRILGGPHVTLVTAARRKEKKVGRAFWALESLQRVFDTLVAGDGEVAIRAAAYGPPGFILADQPGTLGWLDDVNRAPWPARDLVDLSSYHFQIDGEPATSMIGQLGCPFGCQFCAGRDTPFLRRVRIRSHTDVIAEMLDIYERYDIKAIMFLDDELNVNRELMPLLTGIQATGIPWKLRGLLKAELFTDEQAEAMYQAGFRQILIGFESGDDRILQNIQKQATRADNTRAVEIARRHGLKVKALMSIGHAGESEQTILATRDWLLQIRPDDFDVTVIQPYPGSPYYDNAIERPDGTYVYTARSGDQLFMEDTDLASSEAQYYKGIPGCYRSFIWTKDLTRTRICELRDSIEDEIRTKLKIPYPVGSSVRYEASMGALPGHILRT